MSNTKILDLVILNYGLDVEVSDLLNNHLITPVKNNKQLVSPYGNYSAIRFSRKDGALVATSDKWSNVQFNFKNFLLDIMPHSAAVAGFVTAGVNKLNISLAILAAMGVWKVIIDSKSIDLTESHAELIKDIFHINHPQGPYAPT